MQLLFCIFLFSFHSNQGKHLRTSAGPSVASYVPSGHKLQQNGLQLENVFVGHIRAVPSYACTGTELGLTSKDDSWVGEGNGIDGQTSIGLQGSVPLAESDFFLFSFHSNQGKHLRTSAGPSVASYVPSGHKLQQNGLQLENVFVGHIRAVPSYACTGTELGLTSKDDSWVGEGNGIDGQTSIGLQGSVPLAEFDFVGMKQYSTQLVVRIQMMKLDTSEKSKKLRCIIVVSTSCHRVFPCNSWLIITFSFYFCSTLYSYSHLLFALVAICSLNL